MIVLVDAGLSLNGGHHSSVLQSAIEQAGARGQTVALVTNVAAASFQATGLQQVVPVLSGTGYERATLASDIVRSEVALNVHRRRAADLLAAEAVLSLAEEVHVLNVGPGMLVTVAMWLQARGCHLEAWLTIYVMFNLGIRISRVGPLHVATDLDGVTYRTSQSAAHIVSQSCPNVLFAATSSARAAEVQLVTGRRPLNVAALLAAQRALNSEVPLIGPYLCLYFGDAKLEKGYFDLPQLVSSLLGKYRDLKVVVQAVGGMRSSEQTTLSLRKIASSNARFIHHEGFLDDDTYTGLLRGALAVVIPYRRDDYVVQSSGIVEEAIWWAVPVVYPLKTEIADMISHLGIQQIGFPGRDLEDVLSAIDTCLTSINQVKVQAEIGSHALRRRRLPILADPRMSQ